MDKKQKIVNADDQELINPDSVHSYDASTDEEVITQTEDIKKGTEEKGPAKDADEPLKEGKSYPDEIADPEEQEGGDEMA